MSQIKPSPSCDCLKQLNDQLPEGTKIETGMLQAVIEKVTGRSITMTGPFPLISTFIRNAKTNKTKSGPPFYPSFCPWCGKKYNNWPEGAEPETPEGDKVSVLFTRPGADEQGTPKGTALIASILALDIDDDGYLYAAFGPESRAELKRIEEQLWRLEGLDK